MKNMNRTALFLGLIFVILSLGMAEGFLGQQSVDELYESAVFEKESEGDLEAAIKLFQEIISRFPESRKVAAKAQLQIGMCYEMLGLKEAQKAYKDVVTNYPEQAEAVRMAREKLSRLQQALTLSKPGVQEFSQRQVWAGNDVDNSGKISPDGRYLSIVDWGTGNLAVRDMSTGKNRNITKNGSWKTDATEFAMSSVWSSDSKKLAYNWVNEGKKKVELYVIGLDDSEPRLLHQMDFKQKWIEPVDWSSDGKDVLVFLTEGRNCQLALISAEDSSIRLLKTFEAVDPVPMNAEFSPDGRFIVYDFPQMKTTREKNIGVITSDGKQSVPLVTHSADDRLMGWSPDGKWILFKSDRTGTWDAWIIPISEGSPAGEPMLVKRGIGMVSPLSFSADGSFYYSTASGMFDVFTAKIDPETGRIVEAPKKEPLPYEGFNTYPLWSPDGKQLMYISMRGHMNRERALCLYSPDTGSVREIDLKDEFVYFAYPHWSPDSRSILLGVEHIHGGNGIYTVDVQTNDVSLIIQAESGDSYGTFWSPAFTPDRKSLYYIHEKETGGVFRIMERDLQSGKEKVLLKTPPNDNNMLSLSPDGKQLALILREEKNMRMLKVMPVEGGEPKELHRFELKGRNIVGLDWSPDGRYIYFVKMVPEGYELWRISAEGGQAENLDLTTPGFISLNFHPDGQRITFASRVADKMFPEIWVMENFLPRNNEMKK
ncbi:MAG: tetratricopeptide repeat protein [Candidatus Aminicenantes bacterium]|nr:tetratricopeptide repeat protein [Candidatus Aminicenantes bacterium]